MHDSYKLFSAYSNTLLYSIHIPTTYVLEGRGAGRIGLKSETLKGMIPYYFKLYQDKVHIIRLKYKSHGHTN